MQKKVKAWLEDKYMQRMNSYVGTLQSQFLANNVQRISDQINNDIIEQLIQRANFPAGAFKTEASRLLNEGIKTIRR